ncbi:KH domain-containing protein, partial [Clostridioides difficile]
GKSARQDIELLLGSQINLQLWVKVKENWRNLQNYINNFGYNDEMHDRKMNKVESVMQIV